MRSWFAASLLAAAALLAGCAAPVTGAGALGGGEVSAAVTAFRAQVAANPTNWQAREKLGYAYLKAGDANSAIQEFEQALALEPKASMCHAYLGWAQLKLENQTKALEAWRAFNDPTKPLLRQELDRLGTLVEIEQGKKLARLALAGQGQGPAAATRDDSYAILNFSLTGAGEAMLPLQKALAAMTIADLAQIKGITVIERTRMQALLDEMRLGPSAAPDPAAALKAGRLLGAAKCVLGGMSEAEGELRIAVSVAPTGQGEPLGSFELSEEKTRVFALQKLLLAQIIELNALKLDPELGRTLPYHYQTLNHEAIVAYGQGLDAQDRQDWVAAQEHFAQAAKLDPFFLLARQARDRVPAGISIRVGEQASADAVGRRIDAATAAQGVSSTRAVQPGAVPPATAPPHHP